jgi:hypothetical protein
MSRKLAARALKYPIPLQLLEKCRISALLAERSAGLSVTT